MMWEELSPEDKKKQLYLNQKQTLDRFLSTGAITPAQYNKSLGDLTEKMGMEEELRAELEADPGYTAAE